MGFGLDIGFWIWKLGKSALPTIQSLIVMTQPNASAHVAGADRGVRA